MSVAAGLLQPFFQELQQRDEGLGASVIMTTETLLLDYSRFSGGGKSMLFVVATGTAVTLQKADEVPTSPER